MAVGEIVSGCDSGTKCGRTDKRGISESWKTITREAAPRVLKDPARTTSQCDASLASRLSHLSLCPDSIQIVSTMSTPVVEQKPLQFCRCAARRRNSSPYIVIPAKGDLCVTALPLRECPRKGISQLWRRLWIPAFAGMTEVVQRSPKAGIQGVGQLISSTLRMLGWRSHE